MAAFRVGQRVVCIKRGPWRNYIGIVCDRQSSLPQYGEVYTISGIVSGPDYCGLKLVELYNAARPETSFMSWQFRPAVRPKTDISIFESLLTPAKPQKVSVD